MHSNGDIVETRHGAPNQRWMRLSTQIARISRTWLSMHCQVFASPSVQLSNFGHRTRYITQRKAGYTLTIARLPNCSR